MDKGQQLRSKLNSNQITFCQGVVDGLSLTEAYSRAYPKCVKSPDSAGARLSGHVRVKAYIEYLRQEIEQPKEDQLILSRLDKRRILGEISRNKGAKDSDRVAAIKTDNQMTGDDAPVRIEGEITLNGILQGLAGTTGLPE